MPLYDATILDNDPDGTALLASVLFATPAAKADALARGRERLAASATFREAMTPGMPMDAERRTDLPAAHLA